MSNEAYWREKYEQLKAQRQWVGLTAAEVFKALEANEQDYNWHGFARDLEAKLKEKNCL